MSEWQDMQQKPNTKLRDLLKNKKAKTRKQSELSKTEQNRLAKLCLSPLELCQYILAKGVRKHGTEALF